MAFHDSKFVSASLTTSPSVIVPSPIPIGSSLLPAPTQSLSFSISRILGLEDDSTRSSSPNAAETNCKHSESREIPNHSPSLDSDNPSSDVDSGRENEACRVKPSSERPRKKKRRTTFSPIEVWELEQVFAKRPYLMAEDEEELVQKLGLTMRNIRFWFQNRRAKLRREEKKSAAAQSANPSNQFEQVSPSLYGDYHLGQPVFPFGYPHKQFGPVHPRFLPNNASYIATPLQLACPCCPADQTQFPEPELQFPDRLNYSSYRSNRFDEPRFSLRMLPRFHPESTTESIFRREKMENGANPECRFVEC